MPEPCAVYVARGAGGGHRRYGLSVPRHADPDDRTRTGGTLSRRAARAGLGCRRDGSGGQRRGHADDAGDFASNRARVERADRRGNPLSDGAERFRSVPWSRPHRARSLCSLRIGEQWTRVNADKPHRELPHGDFEVRPTTAWNYGLVGLGKGIAGLIFEERPIGERPFSPEGAGMTATVLGFPRGRSSVGGPASSRRQTAPGPTIVGRPPVNPQSG